MMGDVQNDGPPVQRAHEYVARRIREGILDGTHSPGERLPVERDLSEQFGVSRSAVRQALLVLEQQGLIKVRSGNGGGPFVCTGSLEAAIVAFENLLVTDATAVDEFARAKLAIEPAIAAVAAETIDEGYLDQLRDNVERSRRVLEAGQSVTELAIEFHSILIRSTGNRYLTVILELLGRTLERLPNSPGRENVDRHRVVREHQQLIEALERHDAERVRELTTEHLRAIWTANTAAPHRS